MKKDSVGENTNLGGVEWHFGNEKDSVGENTNLGREHQPRQRTPTSAVLNGILVMKKDSVGVNTNLGGVEWHFGNEKDSVGVNTNLGSEYQPRQ